MSKNFNQIVIADDTFAQWIHLTNQMANAYKNVVTTATNTAGDTTAGNAFVSGIFGANTLVVNYEMRGGDVDTAANLAVVSNVVFSGANSTFTSNVFINTANLTVNANTFAVLGVGGGNAVTISTNSTITNSVLTSHYLNITGNTRVINTASFSNSVAVTGAVRLANTQSFVTGADAMIAAHGANTVTISTATANVIDSFSGTSFRAGKYIVSVKDNTSTNFQVTEIMVMHDDSTTYVTEYATLKSGSSLAQFSANLTGTPGTLRLWATPTTSNSTYQIVRTLTSV